MKLLSCLFAIVAVPFVLAYECPRDGSTFYHAEVDTGCQVYHLCQNGEMSTLTCPSGQAFDHHTSQCLEASTVHCEEHGHHMHRRSTEEVHSISIEALKKDTIQLYHDIHEIVRKSVNKTAPTLFHRLETNYTPIFKAMKDDMAPIFKDKVLPRVEKAFQYSLKLGGKLLTKLQRSYELSNSTHLNLVSVADIMEEITNDLKPVLKLGRYLSSRLVQQPMKN